MQRLDSREDYVPISFSWRSRALGTCGRLADGSTRAVKAAPRGPEIGPSVLESVRARRAHDAVDARPSVSRLDAIEPHALPEVRRA